ncbi:MAG: hypothetical protein J0H81_16325, partial [Sphingopyxis terrae]|nr:hypothetical protein [Sphingopyxis terrae]
AFSPGIGPPTSVSAVATTPNTDSANSGDSYFPQDYSYIVSAVNSDGQESRGSAHASATNDTELPRNFTTITWAAPAGDVDYYRIYKAHESGSFGYIGETTSLSFVDDGYQPDYADAPIEAYDPFDATGKYPSRLGFWEQRLWFGGTTSNPNGVFASRSADFENMDFARPQRENDSIAMSISTGQSNVIEAFIPMDRLLVGTSDNIFSLVGPNDDVLVPTPPPGAKRHVGRGIALPKPIMVGEVAFYQPRIESGLRTLGYTFEIDGYRSNDVSIFAPHLFQDFRIVRMAYQAEPGSILWCVRNDGKLLAFTWEAEQQVWGWTEMDVGGNVLDVCCVPEGEESRVYLIVEREIGEATVRYVEYLDRLKWTDYRTASFLDCSKIYAFEDPQITISGLAHRGKPSRCSPMASRCGPLSRMARSRSTIRPRLSSSACLIPRSSKRCLCRPSRARRSRARSSSSSSRVSMFMPAEKKASSSCSRRAARARSALRSCLRACPNPRARSRWSIATRRSS